MGDCCVSHRADPKGRIAGTLILTGLFLSGVTGCEAAQTDTQDEAQPAPEPLQSEIASTQTLPTTIPDWARANIRYMSEGSGRWVADNARYKSETEPWDQYVIEWRAGPDDLSMTARLYALKDDTPSSADFWSLYQYWDMFADEMRVVQSGLNALGDGTLWWDAQDRIYVAEQTFGSPGGTGRTVRHETVELSATEHETRSFYASESGDWIADRTYIWVRSE